jgi:hypothetical protein
VTSTTTRGAETATAGDEPSAGDRTGAGDSGGAEVDAAPDEEPAGPARVSPGPIGA